MFQRKTWVLMLALALMFTSSVLAQETITLTVGIQDNLLFKDEHLAQAVADFMAANPNVRIELRLMSADAIVVQMAADVGPDIIAATASEALGLFSQGAIRDLTAIAANDGDFREDAFLPGMLSSYSDGGTRWGIPFNVLAWATTYNMDYFDMAGIPLPEVGPNWTWDTIREAGRKLTVVAPDGTTSRYGLMLGYNTAPSWPAWVPLTYQAGGGMTDRGMNPTKVNMGTQSVRDALNFMLSLWDDGMMAKVGGVTVRNGKAAMNMTFTPRTVDYWQGYLGPHARIGQIQQPRGPVQDGWFVDSQGFSIATRTAHEDIAWEFVKFLTLRPESAYSLMTDAGRMSVLTENLSYFAQNVEMASVDQVLYALGNVNNVTRPVFPPGLMGIIDGELAKVANHTVGLEAALQDIQRMVDASLAEYHSGNQ